MTGRPTGSALVRPGERDRVRTLPAADDVILFAGHMVDLPDRLEPRFPPERVPAARDAVLDALQGLVGGLPGPVLAMSAAARGGDLLFIEACRKLGVPHVLCLPFDPERFSETSVEGAGPEWVERFRAALDAAADGLLLMPDDYARPTPGASPFARFNLWLVEMAGRLGERTHLIALWDGKGGDGPGGTRDMVRRVREAGGRVVRVDPAELEEGSTP